MVHTVNRSHSIA